MPASQGDNWRSYLIPKEHGAWAMWVLPFFIGVAAAGQVTVTIFLMFGCCLLVFAARTALGAAIRLHRRNKVLAKKLVAVGLIQLLAAFGCALPILLNDNGSLLLVAVLVGMLLLFDLGWIKERSEHNLVAELSGVAGFALTAPAAYIAITGIFNFEAALIWAVCFAFFAGSVFYVKLRVARMAQTKHSEPVGERLYSRLTLGYVAVMIALTLSFSILRLTPGWLLLAFAPWIVHMLWDVFNWSSGRNIYRVGWTLVAHSIYFTVFVSLIFALN